MECSCHKNFRTPPLNSARSYCIWIGMFYTVHYIKRWLESLSKEDHLLLIHLYAAYWVTAPVVTLSLGRAKAQFWDAVNHAKAEIEVFDIPTAYLNAQLIDDKRHLMKFPRYLAQLLVLAYSTAKDFIQQDGTILVEIYVHCTVCLSLRSAGIVISLVCSLLVVMRNVTPSLAYSRKEISTISIGASSLFTSTTVFILTRVQRCVTSCTVH